MSKSPFAKSPASRRSRAVPQNGSAKTKTGGHAAHTQDAMALGLSGTMHRPIKLTFLGAGSSFAPRLVNDVIRIPGNRGGTIALVDIDEARLKLSARLIRKLIARDRDVEGRRVDRPKDGAERNGLSGELHRGERTRMRGS